MEYRSDTPTPRFGEVGREVIPRDLALVRHEIAAIREKLDAVHIPGYAHKAPEYDVLPQIQEPRDGSEALGTEVVQRVVSQCGPVPRRVTY